MRLLVTGGAGYLGSIMVPALLAEGHEVTVIDSFMYNQNSLLDCCHHPALTVVRGNDGNLDPFTVDYATWTARRPPTRTMWRRTARWLSPPEN